MVSENHYRLFQRSIRWFQRSITHGFIEASHMVSEKYHTWFQTRIIHVFREASHMVS
jgi:hypothetical protein